MKLLIFLVAAMIMMMGPSKVLAEEMGKLGQGYLLPEEVSGWKLNKKEQIFTPMNLFSYIDGAAELYLSYGFQGLHVRGFEKPGQPSIIVDIYELASSEDAYGVFSSERQDASVGIGQGSEFGGGLLRFWKGKYFVSIYTEGEITDTESTILDIGRAVSGAITATGPEPKLLNYLPDSKAGLIEKNVRYLRSHVLLNLRFFISQKNILLINRQTEVVLAPFLRQSQKAHLLLVRYPEVHEAEVAFQSFLKAYMPEAVDKDRLKTEDKKWTFVRQYKEFVVIVFGAPQESDGEELVRITEEKLKAG